MLINQQLKHKTNAAIINSSTAIRL